MKNIGSLIRIFISIGLANSILFIIYMSLANLPGGEVGMMPFAILIEFGFSAVITIIIYLFSKLIKELNLIKLVLIYHIIYFGLLISKGLNYKELYKFKSWNYDLFIVLIAVIIWSFTYYILKQKHATAKS